MDSIRLQRLRCLSDTGDIAIKPITILVGQNSSGKSSFLRFFPLLRQSVEARLSGPILWNGRLVDFGNYENAHQEDSEEGICFSFRFKIEPDEIRYWEKSFPLVLANIGTVILDDFDIGLTIKLGKKQEKERTITHQIILKFADSEVIISAQDDGSITEFYVNSFDILELGHKYIMIDLDEISIFPSIIEQNSFVETQESLLILKELDSYFEFVGFLMGKFKGIFVKLIEQIQKIDHSRTDLTRIFEMASMFGIGTSEQMLEYIKNNKYRTKSWENKTKSWTLKNKNFSQIRDLIIAISVPYLIGKCNEKLEKISKHIKYMGPVRAGGERYNRMQDLAVDEIDYHGVNLAVFLQNLTDKQRENFQDWTLRNFEFALQTKSTFGLISVEIQPKNSRRSFSVVDTGFGFSQMLPIITQLWFISEYPEQTLSIYSLDTPLLFAIEQPELHLHPRLQGILTDVFVNSIKETKEKNIDLRLIIETHSEVLISRLGYLILEKKISPDDINIVLFEPHEQGKTIVKTTQFNENGYLEYWPLGFLDPDYNAD